MDTKKMFHKSDETYDKLQWLFRIVFPKLLVLIGALGEVLKWDKTAIVLTVLSAVLTFVGESLGLASENYNKQITK